mgnify:CR=1 FL=1
MRVDSTSYNDAVELEWWFAVFVPKQKTLSLFIEVRDCSKLTQKLFHKSF